MNPGLVRITNGEDIFTNVSSLSDAQSQGIYNNMMLDPRWSKFMLQSGFKRTATPLYWQIGQLHQDAYPGAIVNMPMLDNSSESSNTATNFMRYPGTAGAAGPSFFNISQNSDPRGFFQTGHRGRMSWIPTDALVETASSGGVKETAKLNNMPSVNCITLVLPKMHKTLYYYRCFITETIYLAGLKNTGINENDGSNFYEYRALDNFIGVPYPTAMLPTGARVIGTPPTTGNDGGGHTA